MHWSYADLRNLPAALYPELIAFLTGDPDAARSL